MRRSNPLPNSQSTTANCYLQFTQEVNFLNFTITTTNAFTQELAPLDGTMPAVLEPIESEAVDATRLLAEIKNDDKVGLTHELFSRLSACVVDSKLNTTAAEKQNFNKFIEKVNQFLFKDGVGFRFSGNIALGLSDATTKLLNKNALLDKELLGVILAAREGYKSYSVFLMEEILQFLQEKTPELHLANRLIVKCYADTYRWGKTRRWSDEMALLFADEVTNEVCPILSKIARHFPSQDQPAEAITAAIKKLFAPYSTKFNAGVQEVVKTLSGLWASNHPEKVVELTASYSEFFKETLLRFDDFTPKASLRF